MERLATSPSSWGALPRCKKAEDDYIPHGTGRAASRGSFEKHNGIYSTGCKITFVDGTLIPQ